MATGTAVLALPALSQSCYAGTTEDLEVRGYRVAPLQSLSTEAHRREIAEAANRAIGGKTNNIGTLTLTPGAVTTSIVDARVSPQSFVGLSPVTKNAAADWATGTTFVWQRQEGTFTVVHVGSPQTDRTYAYVVIG